MARFFQKKLKWDKEGENMPLKYGNLTNLEGMSLGIYEAMDEELSKYLVQAIQEVEEHGEDKTAEMLEKALDNARDNWKKLAYCIAKGVVDHIVSNMEIKDIKIVESVKVSGSTKPNQSSGYVHQHQVDIVASNSDLTFATEDYLAIDGHIK
jgi:hypothetical protein